MKKRAIVAGVVVVVVALLTGPGRVRAGTPDAPGGQTCDENPPDGYVQRISGTVEGDTLELAVSSRFGGAVESVTWRGKEFINIFDHGRQISYAWGMDGYGECLNPTEPGSANDERGPTSTSQLLSVCREADNRLTTTTQPAFWLAPGQSGFCDRGVTGGVNETVLSEHRLEKTIEIGYEGIDNVIAFTARVTLPEDYASNQLEIPTGYLTYEFTDYWLYNPQSGELQEPASQPLHEPWSYVHVTNLPPILATPDGAYAMGAYTADPIVYYSILFYDAPDPANSTNKWNIVAREDPAPAGTYTYRSFAIVGTLEQVQGAMDELYRLHPSDFNPPTGYIDVANCEEIAGWAWDPKTPNQPIEVAIYDLGEDGTETLMGRVSADRPREDLPPVLGDNGEHGYRVVTSDIVNDGDRHTLLAYAVNSDPALPDKMLFGSRQAIECPQFAREPEAPADETAPVADEADEPAPESEGSGALPCLGGALPAAIALAAVMGRRRQDVLH